jgi:hypothetical protein
VQVQFFKLCLELHSMTNIIYKIAVKSILIPSIIMAEIAVALTLLTYLNAQIYLPDDLTVEVCPYIKF